MTTVDIRMPLMGEGISEATLVRWLKKTGDAVSRDEPLFEVATDKVTTEIPAPADGVLDELLVSDDAVIAVNQVLARLKTDSSQLATHDVNIGKGNGPATPIVESNENLQHEHAPPKTSKTDVPGDKKLRSSPLVRKMAKDEGLSLEEVTGSGIQGRITKFDMQNYLESKKTAKRDQPEVAQPELMEPAKKTEPQTDFQLNITTSEGVEFLEGVAVRREKMDYMRRTIARRMVETVRRAPHVTSTHEVNLHKVALLRDRLKADFFNEEGFKLTYTPFFIEAAAKAIENHPVINVSTDGAHIFWKRDINIGCAVAIPNGLVVPVIKNANEYNLRGIARKLNSLVSRARQGLLKADELQGGSFSITNPGSLGSIISSPLINQPQVAILGIGAVIVRPIVVDGMIAIRPMVFITLTFDHRVIDGEGASRYLSTVRELLENYGDTRSLA